MLSGGSSDTTTTTTASSLLGGDRRDSRKRRRLSERRRLFCKTLGHLNSAANDGFDASLGSRSSFSLSHERRKASSNQEANQEQLDKPLFASSEQEKISMRIQFYITVAPEAEQLILEPASQPSAQTTQAEQSGAQPSGRARQASIGEQIHERLAIRQNTLSQRRRQQLLAMHQQHQKEDEMIAGGAEVGALRSVSFAHTTSDSAALASDCSPISCRPDSHPRSSTISGCSALQDEATARFIQSTAGGRASASSLARVDLALASSASNMRARNEQRQHIYFKRDGQRFGHEFTLKLAVERSYRCLLKLRPLIPLQTISIQGHQVNFVDCSATAAAASRISSKAGQLSSSAPSSSLALSGQQQQQQQQQRLDFTPPVGRRSIDEHGGHRAGIQNGSTVAAPQRDYRHKRAQPLGHAQTHIGDGRQPVDCKATSNSASQLVADESQLREQLLRQQQQQHFYQQQMLRHFASSSPATSSSSASHHLNAGQLVYMFDWSAGRQFEVNKNKDRTQLQTVLKFCNGQILSLPLQVKFYQPESRQHLSWGNQLHFIDYDCQINSLGQISVHRVQYY